MSNESVGNSDGHKVLLYKNYISMVMLLAVAEKWLLRLFGQPYIHVYPALITLACVFTVCSIAAFRVLTKKNALLK